MLFERPSEGSKTTNFSKEKPSLEKIAAKFGRNWQVPKAKTGRWFQGIQFQLLENLQQENWEDSNQDEQRRGAQRANSWSSAAP